MQEGTPIKIDHLGAKNCVTGSCHLMQIPVDRGCVVNILVDCGKAQGKDPELPFDAFPAAPGKIEYLFLTHAHIDHIGRVPDLIEAGFEGEIICTHGTKALLVPMLLYHLHRNVNERSRQLNKDLMSVPGDLNMGKFFL
jgi:metallo-beta-lactamase family protein